MCIYTIMTLITLILALSWIASSLVIAFTQTKKTSMTALIINIGVILISLLITMSINLMIFIDNIVTSLLMAILLYNNLLILLFFTKIN